MHTDPEREIGAYLIGNIDDNGYLQCALEEVADTVGIGFETVEKVLEVMFGQEELRLVYPSLALQHQ